MHNYHVQYDYSTVAIDGPCGLNEKSRENDSTFILIASTARYLNSNRGNLSWNWKHLFYPFYRIFFLNIRRRGQSWLVEDWILERCEDLTKKTSKRKFVPVSFCLEIKEKFYRENRGIDARRKRSWDGVFFATNRSVGKRLRMARWHLTFSPFFSPPPPSSTFPPLPFRRLFQARTIRLNYRGAHGVKWVSARGQESTRNGGRTAFRGLHSEDGFWYLTLSIRNSDRTSRLHPRNHPLRDTLRIFSTSFCWTCSYTEALKKLNGS